MTSGHAEVTSYWVTPGRLMAGPYPGSPERVTSEAKLASLVERGVRSFVDLTEPGEVTRFGPLRDYQGDLEVVSKATSAPLSYTRFPIRDLGIPPHGLMVAILDALDTALSLAAPAYVHCLGGRGRTGVVVGCYLVRHAERLLGTTDVATAGSLALERITELRIAQCVPLADDSPQTQPQREMVLGWRPGQ